MGVKDTTEQEKASVKVKRTVSPGDSFEDSKKCRKKKKKQKKLKKEKLNKKKSKTKGQQWLKDDADCCESISFTQIPEIKKKKKKKKNDVTLNEEFPLLLTQRKKSNLSKRHKRPKDNSQAEEAHKLKSVVQPMPDELEPMKPALEEPYERSTPRENIRHKRRVMFRLSPEEILSISKLHPTPQTQTSSTGKPHSPHTVFSGNGSLSKPPFEENDVELQSTSDYVDSQDLFITQKSFSEPNVDISSSPSTDEGVAVPPYQNSTQYRAASQETPETPSSCTQTAEASTQTENFFTSPGLATSLRFHHQSTASLCTEEPMDLSIPNRTRQEVCLHLCDSKPVEHQSHSGSKATDLTSSDESDILSKSKADLSHLKVVQTRLNESFFFRVKGEGDSPKPKSPLMVLTGSADKKLKK